MEGTVLQPSATKGKCTMFHTAFSSSLEPSRQGTRASKTCIISITHIQEESEDHQAPRASSPSLLGEIERLLLQRQTPSPTCLLS